MVLRYIRPSTFQTILPIKNAESRIFLFCYTFALDFTPYYIYRNSTLYFWRLIKIIGRILKFVLYANSKFFPAPAVESHFWDIFVYFVFCTVLHIENMLNFAL